MRALWTRLRAFLRGPSDDALRLDLAIIRRRLDRLEADWAAEAERTDASKVVRLDSSMRTRRALRGLEG